MTVFNFFFFQMLNHLFFWQKAIKASFFVDNSWFTSASSCWLVLGFQMWFDKKITIWLSVIISINRAALFFWGKKWSIKMMWMAWADHNSAVDSVTIFIQTRLFWRNLWNKPEISLWSGLLAILACFLENKKVPHSFSPCFSHINYTYINCMKSR